MIFKLVLFVCITTCFSGMSYAQSSTSRRHCSQGVAQCGSTDGSQAKTSGCEANCQIGAKAVCEPGKIEDHSATGGAACTFVSDDFCYCSG